MSSDIVNKEGEIVARIAGHGQFKLNKETLDKVNKLDNDIVSIVEKDDSDKKKQEREFREKLIEIMDLITAEGKALPEKEIVQSDIVIPNPDVSVEELKKIFTGQGLLPDI